MGAKKEGSPSSLTEGEILKKGNGGLVTSDEEFVVLKSTPAPSSDSNSGISIREEGALKGRTKRNHRLSRTDANSIVGGASIEDVFEGSNSIANEVEEQQEPEKDLPRIEKGYKSDYSHSQKVFSFSLPFGGLSSISSNLYKQIHSLSEHLPTRSSHDEVREDLRLKLERQQTINTVEEAYYFKNLKGTENVRLRAVKHTIASNLNEILPDFIHNKKEKEKWQSIYDEIEGNIVIMGGYRGSILRDAKTNKRVWIPIKAGFHLRKINLLLGPTKEDELNASKYIYPSGVLKNVGPVDICKKLIKKLSNNPKTNVIEFGYDWRLSGDYLSKELEDFLGDVYKKTKKPTLVIAHSMGGIIAHGTLQRNPSLFRSIIYVGSPSECLNILGPIRFGDSVILSDKILTFETNFMMRSSFLFLPLKGRVFANTETNEYFDLDYFDPDTWVEYNLNPLVAKKRKILEETGINSQVTALETSSSFSTINNLSSKLKNYRTKSITRKNKPSNLSDTPSQNISIVKSPMSADSITTSSIRVSSPIRCEDEQNFSFTFTEAYNYLADTLQSAKKFILGLEFREDLKDEYPPLAMVYGNTVPSVRGSNVHGLQDIKDGDYYNFYYGHGDGVVHQRWLMPEKKGFRFYNNETGEGEIVGKFSSDCGHVNLMTDFRAIGQALVAVSEAEVFWKNRKKKKAQDELFAFNDEK